MGDQSLDQMLDQPPDFKSYLVDSNDPYKVYMVALHKEMDAQLIAHLEHLSDHRIWIIETLTKAARADQHDQSLLSTILEEIRDIKASLNQDDQVDEVELPPTVLGNLAKLGK